MRQTTTLECVMECDTHMRLENGHRIIRWEGLQHFTIADPDFMSDVYGFEKSGASSILI